MPRTHTILNVLTKGFILGLGAAVGVVSVAAWTGPTGSAPNSNVSAPINVSGTTQYKPGIIQAVGFSDDNAAYYADFNTTSNLNSLYVNTFNSTGAARFTGYGTDTWFPYSNGYNYIRGNVIFNGWLQDENDTNYYLDPAGTSRINYGVWNNLYVYGDVALAGLTVNSEFYIAGIQTGSGTHYLCWNNAANRVKKKGDSGCDTSDARLKKNIKPLQRGLAEVVKLNPVSFEWKDKELYSAGTKFGLVAQDVKEVLPEAVNGGDEEDEYYSLDYNAITASMINAIKELKAENDELRARIETLEAKN